VITPETEPFWLATAAGRLILPRCEACGTLVWYPKGVCGSCGSTSIEWIEASGRGTVYSYTVAQRGFGAYRQAVPYVLAVVELEEGPRVITNVVGRDPSSIRIGDLVTAVFEPTGEGPALVRFARPGDP
jgi:hypothetical protein